eukprot:CAMPEP_0118975282 /NCGR_PEP_ID=MMETSP1173-20130426/15329_1 /TAXON_ID=1034831 /ORGANISM="Rhizochromulina marina cf, Strain CCMP1243" /LENGTH=361 /DNA_ID=CAMNT_0006925147 /DNA_START=57 /DNA_END=1142 /DNA_ORIENTATION=-
MAEQELRQRKPAAAEADKPAAPGAAVKQPPKRLEFSREKEAERWTKLISSASESAPPAAVPYLKMMAPVLSAVLVGLHMALPLILSAAAAVDKFFQVVPAQLLVAVFGALICFFGGMYPATIAAMEAWQQAGGRRAYENARDLYIEFKRVMHKSAEDDLKDEDGDGIADVDQISGKELFMRKAHIALTTCDPDKLNGAIQGIYTGWVGVIAVLKIQFAKTIALGSAIGDFLYSPALRVATPVLVHLIPEDYHRWIPSLVLYVCKSIALSIAWYVQRVISAFHSAIRGGLLCSRGVLNFMNSRGIIDFNDTESYLDEIVGWSLAAAGFYFQFMMGFSMPFPFNLLLWPFGVAEWYIVWTVSS